MLQVPTQAVTPFLSALCSVFCEFPRYPGIYHMGDKKITYPQAVTFHRDRGRDFKDEMLGPGASDNRRNLPGEKSQGLLSEFTGLVSSQPNVQVYRVDNRFSGIKPNHRDSISVEHKQKVWLRTGYDCSQPVWPASKNLPRAGSCAYWGLHYESHQLPREDSGNPTVQKECRLRTPHLSGTLQPLLAQRQGGSLMNPLSEVERGSY